MVPLLAVLITTGLGLIVVGDRIGRSAHVVAGVVTGAGFLWAVTRIGPVVGGDLPAASVRWVDQLGLKFDLRLDGFGLVMVLLICGIGTLVQIYARSYFGHRRDGLARLAGLLVVFTAAMIGVVTASNLVVLYLAWEATSVCSYLLIGGDDTNPDARAAALQALLTTAAGGLAMLAGIVLLGTAAGTFELQALADRVPNSTVAQVGVGLILIGAFTKSAQFPFGAWLPGAMVAPTPISAFLHSATMVKAGVFLIGRLAPMFAPHLRWWTPVVCGVGLVTMVTGGWRALRQDDLKRVLAFGTISQLGFLVAVFGVGTREAATAGVTLLIAHALFKAGCFLMVGVVDHQAHARDIRVLGRYGPGWTGPGVIAVLSAASMAGLPLFAGFVAKEAAFDLWAHESVIGAVAVVVGSVLTFAYTARLVLGACTTTPVDHRPVDTTDAPLIDPPAAPSAAFWAPGVLLAAGTVIIGVVPGLVSPLVEAATRALVHRPVHVHLSLWHGFGPAVWMSIVTVGVGVLLVAGRAHVGRLAATAPALPDGTSVFQTVLHGTTDLAGQVIGRIQTGSMPMYLGVTFAVAALLPGWALLSSPMPDLPSFVTGWGDLPAAVLMIGGAIAAARTRDRLASVLCLGAVGFGIALTFVLLGAPDLALTQVCVDTISAVVFVLVLRRLPRRYTERQFGWARWWRVGVSALVGVFVFAFVLIAADARVHPSVATEFLRRAYDEGGGRNVVNVVLVDIRGFDTMGEITVLAVAAMGVYALAKLSRREVSE